MLFVVGQSLPLVLPQDVIMYDDTCGVDTVIEMLYYGETEYHYFLQ